MVRVDLGRGANGRRRRKIAYASTQADAIKLLKRLNGREVNGQLVATSLAFLGEDDPLGALEDDGAAGVLQGHDGRQDERGAELEADGAGRLEAAPAGGWLELMRIGL